MFYEKKDKTPEENLAIAKIQEMKRLKLDCFMNNQKYLQ